MYYAFIQDNKINGTGQCRCLNEDVLNIEITEEIFNAIVSDPLLYVWDGERIIPNPRYEEEKDKEEHERIQTLSMTRSDFFDATIKAFGMDGNDFLPIVRSILNNLPIDAVQKKIAINNYENAQNFYRKHTLFTLLSGVEIPIGEETSIVITSEQWDKFFDETNKKNPEAYKELLPAEINK